MTLLQKLDGLAYERGILPKHFRCPSYEACNSSTGDKMDGGASCMLSYVGPLLQSESSMLPRLAIVGMDHGRNEGGSYSERTQGIIECYIQEGKPFNEHYKGVVRTAAAFLGVLGANCCENCQSNRTCRKSHESNVNNCVLEQIAQPNIVKCVPETKNMTSRATTVMRNNCFSHLLAEWEVYRPTICVFHGKKSREAVFKMLEGRSIGFEKLPIETNTRDISIAVPSMSLKMFFFSHPSRGHLNRQWEGDVEPSLVYLRTIGEVT